MLIKFQNNFFDEEDDVNSDNICSDDSDDEIYVTINMMEVMKMKNNKLQKCSLRLLG